MRMTIRSVNAENDEGLYYPKGKSMTVEAQNYELFAVGTETRILAECEETLGDGTRGGEPKTTVRRLIGRFDKNDITTIVDAIMGAGLLPKDGGKTQP